MANSTMTYTGPADGQASVTFTHTGTIPDAIAPNFFACYRAAYRNYYDEVANKVTPNATQPDPGTPGATINNPVATDAEIYERFAQGIAEGVAAQCTMFMKAQARAQAEAQVEAAIVTQTQ